MKDSSLAGVMAAIRRHSDWIGPSPGTPDHQATTTSDVAAGAKDVRAALDAGADDIAVTGERSGHTVAARWAVERLRLCARSSLPIPMELADLVTHLLEVQPEELHEIDIPAAAGITMSTKQRWVKAAMELGHHPRMAAAARSNPAGRLSDWCKAAELSIRDLAGLAGVSKTSMADWMKRQDFADALRAEALR